MSDLRLPPAYRLVALDTIDSTNAEAKRRAQAGAEDGTLIWAREQTEARGRYDRRWAAPRGNLYFSMILRPDCTPAQATQLSFVSALGVGDGVGAVVPPLIEVRYKWPNDVLFNDRKGVGILLESQVAVDGGLDWLVVGIGINVKSYPEDTSFPATSLHFEGAPPALTVEAVLESFGRHFMTWVNRWLDDGFAPIRKAWLSHARGIGEVIDLRLANESLRGTFRDLDETGAMLLDLPDGNTRTITVGDVFFLD